MSNPESKSLIRKSLDWFHDKRRDIGDTFVYYSIWFTGIEVPIEEVRKQSIIGNDDPKVPDFNGARDPQTLLATSRVCFELSQARRLAVIEKCKTLLAFSTLLLGLVGILLPKQLTFDSAWMRISFFVALMLFLHSIVLLLLFFVTGNSQEIDIEQRDAWSGRSVLAKKLARDYLACRNDTDNRTDYLYVVYNTARFYFFGAFIVTCALFAMNFFTVRPADPVEQLVMSLRSNTKLVELLRGPKGDRGETGRSGGQGEPGKDATLDENQLIERILRRLSEESGTEDDTPQTH